MNGKITSLSITIALGVGLTLGLVWLLWSAAPLVSHAQGPDGHAVYYVAPSCTGVPTPCFSTVQAAVDAADDPSDTVRIATGVYTDVNDRLGLSQVVYISKTLILQGGYTTGDWSTPHPLTQPTTLDAEGRGRVLYITGDVTPVVEGLRLSGGDAAGLGGSVFGKDAGGGIYVSYATPTMRGNWIVSNTAQRGGGVYLLNSAGVLTGNAVLSNSAAAVAGEYTGHGGGLLLEFSDATLVGNTIAGNRAVYDSPSGYGGDGGGLHLYRSSAVISANTFMSNAAGFHGGGLYLDDSDAWIRANTFTSNTAMYSGGGIHLQASDATLVSNTLVFNHGGWGGGLYAAVSAGEAIRFNEIVSNTAKLGGGGATLDGAGGLFEGNRVISNTADWYGGGLYLFAGSTLTVLNNTISENASQMYGGGVAFSDSPATLIGNTIEDNRTPGDGGGLHLDFKSSATLVDNRVAHNAAGAHGGGMFAGDRSDAIVLNNGFLDNSAGGDGGGIYAGVQDLMCSFNSIISNSAQNGGGLSLGTAHAVVTANTVLSNVAIGNGGGMHIASGFPHLDRNAIQYNEAGQSGGGVAVTGGGPAFANTLVAGNHAGVTGSGIFIGAAPSVMLHTTIASNTGGDGSGVHATGSTVQMTNTIIVSQTVGAFAPGGLSLQATLWGTATWSNGLDWAGGGVTTGTVSVWGDPAFVDSASGDYHIGATSGARDIGVDEGVDHDIDGEIRPMDWAPDAGADEYFGVGLSVVKRSSDVSVNGGQVITYTVVVVNVGADDATGTVLTDTLDPFQRPITATSSVGACSIGSTGWGGVATCPLGTIAHDTAVVVTVTAQISPSVGVGQVMVNQAVVAANETANGASFTTYGQDCHARINDAVYEFTTVQAAVDAANPGDLIKVAGACVGAGEREELRQQVYLDKEVTLRGGYSISDWLNADPVANPTTLDAMGQGRVFYITGDISPTVEGLRITGGDATGLGGHWTVDGDSGGGAYVDRARVVFRNNWIYGNVGPGNGGGMYLTHSWVSGGHATLEGNTFTSNTADYGAGAWLLDSPAVVTGNLFLYNDGYQAGGIFLFQSNATVVGNTFAGNDGGGLAVSWSYGVLVRDNTFDGNTGPTYSGGGGLSINGSDVTVEGNRITRNTCTPYGEGCGIQVVADSQALIQGNVVLSNTAREGGGVSISGDSDATLINNVIAGNAAERRGSGLFVSDATAALYHNTIVDNTGSDGVGIYVTDWDTEPDSVQLVNTILFGHAVGITVTASGEAVLEGTVWGNAIEWGGDGTVVTGTVNVWGDPHLIGGDYHIGPDSVALNAGVPSGVDWDIDGETRPAGWYDIGADEYVGYTYLPLVLRAIDLKAPSVLRSARR
jgi:uncharacterized repeat protein (TIGR01451 family)